MGMHFGGMAWAPLRMCLVAGARESNMSSVPHSGVTVWWSACLIWVRSPC